MKKIKILVPIHNEEKNIPAFWKELTRATKDLQNRLEFVMLFVDDGSTDDSLKILEELAAANENVRILELSRNFQKEVALSAGIDHLDCDAVIIMDADLQHPPSYIPKFIQKWDEGFDIVATKRVYIENQPLARRLGSFFFYQILNAISEFKMEPGTTDFRLLDRKVIDALKTFKEKNRMVRGLIDWMGYKKVFIEFNAPERNGGVPAYSYKKLFKLALNSLVSFSLFPLRIAGYIGLLITLTFSALLIFMITDSLTFGKFGFTSISFVIVANAIFSGITLTALGLVALYIGHIHSEVIDRPLYLLRRKIGFNRTPLSKHYSETPWVRL